MFQSLVEKMSNAFSKFRNKGKLTEADVKAGMREIKLALLEADVNFKVVKEFVARVSERAVGNEVLESLLPAQQIVKIVNEELVELMGGTNQKINISPKPPTVILMCGLQGSGKTTHCGKLARMFKKLTLAIFLPIKKRLASLKCRLLGAMKSLVDKPVAGSHFQSNRKGV